MNDNNLATILMIITKKYNNFDEYFRKSEESIYRKMIDVYGQIKNSEEDKLFLVIHSTIRKRSFNTTHPINKDSSVEIKTVIIPYFEKIEDYETCDRALKLYNYINR